MSTNCCYEAGASFTMRLTETAAAQGGRNLLVRGRLAPDQRTSRSIAVSTTCPISTAAFRRRFGMTPLGGAGAIKRDQVYDQRTLQSKAPISNR